MRALERGPHLAHGLDHRERPRGEVATAGSACSRLIDQLLEAIDRRQRDAQRRLEQLARQRAVMPPTERSVANETLRAEAVAIRDELARLNLDPARRSRGDQGRARAAEPRRIPHHEDPRTSRVDERVGRQAPAPALP